MKLVHSEAVKRGVKFPRAGRPPATSLVTTIEAMPYHFTSATLEPAGVSRSRVDLGGTWERHIHDKLLDRIQVPSSQHPIGYYKLRREFLLPRLSESQRAYVHFEAITYFGRVKMNGEEVGTMGPYVPYE